MRGALGGQEVSVRLASVTLVVLAVVALAVGCGGGPPKVDWSGTWREIGTPQAYTLTLTPEQGGNYSVEYPRSFKVPFQARTEDGKLLVWGENTGDIVWTLSYDEASGELTAVGRQDTFHFERVQK
jgi:hypothetical protein